MSNASSARRLEDHLCFSVYAVHHAFSAAYKPLLEPLGLTYTQYIVLLVLWEHDSCMVKEIGARLQLDSGTLTPVLKRMERAELIRRNRDAADERQLRIELTSKGRALQAEAKRIYDTLGCALGGTDQSLTALRASLTALIPQLRPATRE